MTGNTEHSTLTTFQRKDAQNHLNYYQFFSGAIGNLLGAPLLTLIVLFLNGNSYALGFVVSIMQFATFLGMLAPAFFYNHDYITHKVRFWKMRGYICAFYFVALLGYYFFLQGTAYGSTLTLILVCVTYGLFCFIRSIGMFSLFPVINATASDHERGKVLSAYTHFSNIGGVLSLLVCYVILYMLSFDNRIYPFLLLIFIGILCNMGSISSFSKTPSIGLIPKMDLIEVAQRVSGFLLDRRLILLWVIKLTADLMIVAFGFSLVYLKKCHSMDDADAILYSLVMFLGRILASLVSGKISDILGQKPLLFYIHLLIITFSVIFIYYPNNHTGLVLLLLLVLLSFFFCFSDILMGQLVYEFAPKQDVVSYGTVSTSISALAALAGGFIVSVLLDQNTESISFIPVWLLVIFYAIAILIMLFFLPSKEAMSLSIVASSFTSFRSWRGVFAISALNEEVDPEKKAAYLNHIAVLNQPYAQKEMIKYLKSGNMITRRSAYLALRLNPLEYAFESVLQEAKREDGFIREEAIYNLRYYPKPEVVSFLRTLSQEENFYGVQAILSLSHILKQQDVELSNLIKRRLETEKIPQYRSRMIYSLIQVADLPECIHVLLKEATQQTSKEYIQFLYISVAHKYKWSENLELAFTLENEEKGAGLYELIVLISSCKIFTDKQDWILGADIAEVLQWLALELKNMSAFHEIGMLDHVVHKDACAFLLISVIFIYKTSADRDGL